MIELDGRHKEGGGQILRTALSLSAIMQKSFTLRHIRAKRQNPGLQPQHLTACFATQKVCGAEMQGAVLKSTELTFIPRQIQGGIYTFDVTTAGAIILVAQTLIPILCFAKTASHLTLIGGTHVTKSPCYDYFEKIFVPAIERFGARIRTKCIQHGFYPKGGGIVEIEIEPSQLKGNSNWKKEEAAWAIIRLARLPEHIAMREKKICQEAGIENVIILDEFAYSPGNAVTCGKGFCGSYVLGERGIRAEMVAREAVLTLQKEKGDVDVHLADQIVLYAALSDGKTRYTAREQSSHLETNLDVIQHFVERSVMINSFDALIEIIT